MHNPNARSSYRFILVQFPALLACVVCACAFVCWVLGSSGKSTSVYVSEAYRTGGRSPQDPKYALMWGVSLLASYTCFSLFRVLWRESK